MRAFLTITLAYSLTGMLADLDPTTKTYRELNSCEAFQICRSNCLLCVTERPWRLIEASSGNRHLPSKPTLTTASSTAPVSLVN